MKQPSLQISMENPNPGENYIFMAIIINLFQEILLNLQLKSFDTESPARGAKQLQITPIATIANKHIISRPSPSVCSKQPIRLFVSTSPPVCDVALSAGVSFKSVSCLFSCTCSCRRHTASQRPTFVPASFSLLPLFLRLTTSAPAPGRSTRPGTHDSERHLTHLMSSSISSLRLRKFHCYTQTRTHSHTHTLML